MEKQIVQQQQSNSQFPLRPPAACYYYADTRQLNNDRRRARQLLHLFNNCSAYPLMPLPETTVKPATGLVGNEMNPNSAAMLYAERQMDAVEKRRRSILRQLLGKPLSHSFHDSPGARKSNLLPSPPMSQKSSNFNSVRDCSNSSIGSESCDMASLTASSASSSCSSAACDEQGSGSSSSGSSGSSTSSSSGSSNDGCSGKMMIQNQNLLITPPIGYRKIASTGSESESEVDSFDDEHAINTDRDEDPLDVPYIESPFHCDYGYNIRCGRNIYINARCTILDCAEVTIGNNVMIGPNVQMFCPGHPLDADLRKTPGALEFALPIHIGNDVWIGGGSIILSGITIGDGSVVGAGSVLTKDVPPGTLVAGNPARIIRKIEPGDLGLPKRYYEQQSQKICKLFNLKNRRLLLNTAIKKMPLTTSNTTAASKVSNKDIYLADSRLPICKLEIRPHFEALSKQERLYAHHLSRACWHGTRIILEQTSPESVAIYNLILEVFNGVGKDGDGFNQIRRKLNADHGVTDDDYDQFLLYCSQFLGNLSNYKSFGDTKFIPRLPKPSFEAIITATESTKAMELFRLAQNRIYALEPESVLMLGYPDTHLSNYYSSEVRKDEIEMVQRFLESQKLNAYNTRLFKGQTGELLVKIASADKAMDTLHEFEGRNIVISFGDYREQMRLIAEAVGEAAKYAASDIQQKMLHSYEESFRTGSIEAHKQSQRWWIKDVGPVVESNLGFIESYRDPAGVRGEWEGFVAIVNKEQTKKFQLLVDNALKFIEMLPWGPSFQKDKFHKPDFTSLEVLTFCTSGVPAGINIPNYDDIRQVDGFKNVSLGNVLRAQAPNEEITFLRPEDKPLFEKFRGKSFEVQVGIHELLGHGSGKLCEQFTDGTANFDLSNPPQSPISGQPIKTWYKNDETWGSKFGSMAASYEECRAESVGIYLSTESEILSIFGHSGQEAEDVLYVNWLLMARAGLLALEFYDVKSKKWGQAHMQARYAILQVMLRSGNGFVQIVPNQDQSDAHITLDRSQIKSTGFKAVADFLTKLQVYKASADVENAKKLYDDYTAVDDSWNALRDLVLRKRQPRKVFVQANTFLRDDGDVVLREYEATPEGLIKSFIERG